MAWGLACCQPCTRDRLVLLAHSCWVVVSLSSEPGSSRDDHVTFIHSPSCSSHAWLEHHRLLPISVLVTVRERRLLPFYFTRSLKKSSYPCNTAWNSKRLLAISHPNRDKPNTAGNFQGANKVLLSRLTDLTSCKLWFATKVAHSRHLKHAVVRCRYG